MRLYSRAGTYKEIVSVYRHNPNFDDSGQLGPPIKECDIRGNVRVVKGQQSITDGSVFTTEVITIQTRNDSRIANYDLVKWNGKMYDINHVRPDETGVTIVITASHEGV